MIRLLISSSLVWMICLTAFAEHRLEIDVVDAETGNPIAARLYLTHAETSAPYFFESTSPSGSAFRYEKQNRLNRDSTEYHTTISAHRAFATVPAGTYELIVERGKTYFPHQQRIVIDDDARVTVRLRSWIDLSRRGWFSGDLHTHRTLAESRNLVLAEDLNVVFPLTQWVTLADTAPSNGNKNLQGQLPNGLIHVDDEHVVWPLNTEYEIFTVGGQRHTLGALFVLGHQQPLQLTVPPWKPVIDSFKDSDPAPLLDMDKVAWPFAMMLPTVVPNATYELANNHLWRTEFAFRDWYTPTPNYMQPPFGGTSGGEREWIEFTFGMYYTLLNSGFRLPPSAGTANGVHPVPAGYSRVYVYLPNGFTYADWKRGLQAGRSFVTTGPMVLATAGLTAPESASSSESERPPGHTFRVDKSSEIELSIEMISEQPLTFAEVVINGSPEHLLRATNQQLPSGAFRTSIKQKIRPTESGWFAIRCYEDRPGNRVRFAHTAPWYIEIADQPVRPSWQERAYLIRRMKDEIQRSRGIVSQAALDEYQSALEFYQALEIDEDAASIATARAIGSDAESWLRNMIVDHRFDASEVRAATGWSFEKAVAAVQRLAGETKKPSGSDVRIMPYPGGRHPRSGFLDGAINPQRDTKLSVFPPWSDGGYAVIDVPEAIFSNLGLTYLAHTHIPTIWTNRGVELESVEWKTPNPNQLESRRTLPNGIEFGSRAEADGRVVRMEMWLKNGTSARLTGLRAQVCVMLKGLIGFNERRRRDPMVRGPLIAIRGNQADRWVITGWEPNQRAWANPPVPCIHSDPVFPDCDPGETVRVRGAIWFYEGSDIEKAMQDCHL